MRELLSVKNVRVEFGPLVALGDVTFGLPGGHLLGLVGPNGAGKTTLLRVLAGLQPPTRGCAFIMGKPVLGEDEMVRQHVGFAPDAPPAYEDLTVDQFLRFIAGAYGLSRSEGQERIDFWLDQLWLTDRRDALIKTLSRGMRQRITLARTFLPQPHAILLDEPLAGLDPAGRIQLRQVLSMLRDQGCAMIVSSHILSDLEEVATHIAIIEHGSILRFCEPHALREQESNRATYVLTVVDHECDCGAALEGVEGVTKVTQKDRTFTFDFHSDDGRAAALLRDVVNGGVAVASFAPVKQSLEDAYLRMGVKQVD